MILENLPPFSKNWNAPRAHEGELVLNSIRARCLTLESECRSLPGFRIQTTASSARLAHRARIELIRKAALAEAQALHADHLFSELDPLSGDPRSTLSRADTFRSHVKEGSKEDVWSLCAKSGVAVHVDPAAACALAWNDLVLSDRVLRSWYGGTPPRPWTELDHLGPGYKTQAYEFLAPSSSGDVEPVITVGIFALASEELIQTGMPPLLFGFGASQGKDSALQRAFEKLLALAACLKRPHSAQNMPIPPWMTSSEGLHSVSAWLQGDRAERKAPSFLRPALERPPCSKVHFADITPPGLLEPVSVVRAVSPSRIISALQPEEGSFDGLVPIPLHPAGVA